MNHTKEKKKEYNKRYYEKCKREGTKKRYLRPSTVDNCINRLMLHDKYIKQFLARVGIERVKDLLLEIE